MQWLRSLLGWRTRRSHDDRQVDDAWHLVQLTQYSLDQAKQLRGWLRRRGDRHQPARLVLDITGIATFDPAMYGVLLHILKELKECSGTAAFYGVSGSAQDFLDEHIALSQQYEVLQELPSDIEPIAVDN